METPSTRSRETWTRRFGTVAGGSAGVLLVFAAAFALKTVSAVFLGAAVSVGFITGAIGGERVALRLGPSRYRTLGFAAGILLAGVFALVYLALLGRFRR